MGRVRLLDDALVDQIAAGEVVERPASVVKELLENAIDAEATSIRVEIREGGKERILVQDDGIGMDREDAILAMRRHATSKIRSLEDLLRVQTMGFRGEALASIASVSKFRVLTRPRDAIEGTEIRIDGGGEPRIQDAGCAGGTTFDVQELFYNVPARRKFLRSRQTETLRVSDVCLAAALSHPELRLQLIHDGRVVREYLPARSRLERARSVMSDMDLRWFKGERDGVRVEAALADPAHARRGTRTLRLLVNGRPVVDHAIARAVAFAFGDALRPRHYPVGVVYLQLPESEVDVNAHPQKTEVRFSAPRRVGDAVTRVIAHGLKDASREDGAREDASREDASREDGAREDGAREDASREDAAPRAAALSASGPAARGGDFWAERLGAGPRTEHDGPRAASHERADEPSSPASYRAATRPANEEPRLPASTTAFVAALRDGGPAQSFPSPETAPPRRTRIVGRLSTGALLVEHEDALLIVEPSRARALLCEPRLAQGASRRLVFPARIELSDAEAAALERRRAAFEAVGMEVRALGPRSVAVHALPEPLHAARDPGQVLRDALDATDARWLRAIAAHAHQPEGDEALLEALLALGTAGHAAIHRIAVNELF